MGSTLVLGIGNTLRRDDGIGFEVVAELQDSAPQGVECRCVHQLTMEFAETISRLDRVIFVDAAIPGNPGDIRETKLQPGHGSGEIFSHECSPMLLLDLAESLYGRVPDAVLLTVTGADFGYGEGLSEQVKKARPQLLERLKHLTAVSI
jgi:hydrogenase maturation protease